MQGADWADSSVCRWAFVLPLSVLLHLPLASVILRLHVLCRRGGVRLHKGKVFRGERALKDGATYPLVKQVVLVEVVAVKRGWRGDRMRRTLFREDRGERRERGGGGNQPATLTDKGQPSDNISSERK